MEEGTKKIVMVVVIVVCLIAAGTIYYINSSGGSSNIPAVGDATVTIKCRACGNEWQMDQREHIDHTRINRGRIGVLCPKCNKPAGYKVESQTDVKSE
ncbi:MAG: hypothetical protein WC476_12310 [Phycisphaerae bacterium]|jgi:hypothetical protein